MVYYLIGVSGVGKSAVCKELSEENSNIVYQELDEIYRRYKQREKNHDLAIEKTEERLKEVENINDGNIYLIDVGSFAQKYLNINIWKERRLQLICLKNTIDFSYKNYVKRAANRMNLERWKKSELSHKRQELYSLSEYVIDCSGLDLLTVKEMVLKIITK